MPLEHTLTFALFLFLILLTIFLVLLLRWQRVLRNQSTSDVDGRVQKHVLWTQAYYLIGP